MVTAQGEDGVLDPQGPVSQAMADLFWLMLGRMNLGRRWRPSSNSSTVRRIGDRSG
jgi:hypothetical protein